jgi:arsenite-transporting ATPase
LISFFAINIDPENSAEEYRNRVTQPLENFFKSRNQENAGRPFRACTEIASFDFLVLYREKQKEKNLILFFDTAPRSHLRLLVPAWSSFTDENPDGASCLGPSALKRKEDTTPS